MILNNHNKGFTIIELVVSVAIFAFMTAFLVAKYGTFNQSVLLQNLAYDVALTIRNAQTYGLNVKSQPVSSVVNGQMVVTQNYSSAFNVAYGVHFDKTSIGTAPVPNTQMIFFADTNSNGYYDAGEAITTYTLRGGSVIYDLCVGSDEGHCSTGTEKPTIVDVTFKRPDPDAVIQGKSGSTTYAPRYYTEITIKATDGSLKKVAVRSTGQIAVLHY